MESLHSMEPQLKTTGLHVADIHTAVISGITFMTVWTYALKPTMATRITCNCPKKAQ